MSNELCKRDDNQATASRTQYRTPKYSVTQNDDAYEVEVYVPGVTKDQVNVTLEKDTLTVVASRSSVKPENWKLVSGEYSSTDYELKLNINVDINEDNISAKTENGVVTISLPVAEAAKAKTITVN